MNKGELANGAARSSLLGEVVRSLSPSKEASFEGAKFFFKCVVY
jgi:hypothetical protein